MGDGDGNAATLLPYMHMATYNFNDRVSKARNWIGKLFG